MFLKAMPLNSSLQNLLDQAIHRRLSMRSITNAIRLVNGQGDGLDGLVLEQYGAHFVAQIFSPQWLNLKEDLKDYIEKNFQAEYFIIKDRTQSALSKPEDFQSQVLIRKTDSKTIVTENKIRFEVDLNDTLNTGLFLDMRHNRLKIAQMCKNKRVLNCFSYTCSFGVYARAHQAKGVINVDISSKILDKGRRNYEINSLEAASGEFMKTDATEYLLKAVKKENRFDVIIIDPPSFARANQKVFNIQKALPQMIACATQILNDEGKIFISTNNSKISFAQLEKIIITEGQLRRPKKIIRLGQDKDFVGSLAMKESYLVALLVEY